MGRLRIQASDSDKLYEVLSDNGVYQCGCSGYAANRYCAHVSKAKDFLDNGFKDNFENLQSAFQKEVRRGDYHKGMTWAHIIKKFWTDKQAKDFYLRVCFDETRNVELYNFIFNSWKDKGQLGIADLLLRSRKRWQSNHEWLPEMTEGYLLQAGNNGFAEDKIRRTMLNSSKLSELYACVFTIFRSDEKGKLINAFKEALQNRMFSSQRIPNRQEVKFLLSVNIGFNELLAICEMACGYWDVSLNEYDPIDAAYIKPNYVPRFEDYIHDNATATGRDRLYNKWFKVRFGKKQPEGIDLRWSALAPGVIWRYCANKQCAGAGVKDAAWESIAVDESLEGYRRVDACLYKMFYGTVHFCHGFDGKLDDDPFFMQVVKDNCEHEDLVRPRDFFGKKEVKQ